ADKKREQNRSYFHISSFTARCLTLAFSGAASGIPMLMRDSLRGLRCNALLGDDCTPIPCQAIMSLATNQLNRLGFRAPTFLPTRARLPCTHPAGTLRSLSPGPAPTATT